MSTINKPNAYPEMLQMGRILRGLTQSELAEKTGIDQGLISKYENGRPIPSQDLDSIASYLQLPKHFFSRQINIEAPYGASMILFRRRQTTSIREQQRVMMELNRLSYHIHVLLESIDVQATSIIPQHKPTENSIDEIEDIANRTRLELRIPPGPISSMVRVLESMKVAIIQWDLPHKIDALLGGIPPLLLISKSLLGGRQRFTLAHELGHLVMHNELIFSYDDMEDQADFFASAFLMPRQDIRSRLRGLTMERLVALSSEWRVSVQALVRRARDLETITDRQYRTWNEQLSKNGFRTIEPVTIPVEQPTLVRSLINLHMTELNYSDEELAYALATEKWEFRNIYIERDTLQLVPKPKKTVLRIADG